MSLSPRKTTSVLLGSIAIAIAWPGTPVVSAAPRIVRARMTAGGAARAPITFNVVAAEWNDPVTAGPFPTMEIRTSPDGVAWSAWRAIQSDDAEADAGSGEGRTDKRFSDPMWVGDGRFVETHGLSKGILDVLNVNGDADDPGPIVRTARAVGRWLRGAPMAEAAGAGPIGIYTRAQWGADERLREQTPPDYADRDKVAIIHHTDTTNNYGPGDVPGLLRGIYYFHVKVRGFRDIGYNFLVDKFGRIWEGRWGGMDKTVVGAHAGAFNYGSIGIAGLGTYQTTAAPTAMLDAIVRLLNWKFTVHRIMPRGYDVLTAGTFDGSRYAPGTRVRLHTISGHRDVDTTDCPGTMFYQQLQYIRDRVRVKVLPAGTFIAVGMATYRILPGYVLAPVPGPVYGTWALGSDRVRISASEVSSYSVGAPLPFRDGSLVQGDTDPTVSIASQGSLRPFTGLEQLTAMGYKESRIIHTTTALLSGYPVGAPVDAAAYPDGTVLRSLAGGPSYLVWLGTKKPIPAAVLASYQITADDVVSVAASVLDAIPIGSPLRFRDGTLMRSAAYPTLYIVSGGARRPFESSGIFGYYGYSTANVRWVTDDVIRLHPMGGWISGH